MTSRTQLEGKDIITRLHAHDKTLGAFATEISSGTGKGKTSMLLSFAKYNMENHPGEKNFFLEDFGVPLQSFKLGRENVQIWCRALDYNYVTTKGSVGRPNEVKTHHGPLLTFRDRDHKLKEVSPEEMGVQWYYTYDELYDKASTTKLNVPVIYPRNTIFNLIQVAASKGEFSNFYIDEFSNVSPFGQSYKRSMKIANLLTALRKDFVNIFYTVQSKTQVDWRTRAVVAIKIFGPGATADKKCRLVQKAIDNLKVDTVDGSEFWIVEGGQFGLFRLKDIFEPLANCNIEIHVTKTAGEKTIDEDE